MKIKLPSGKEALKIELKELNDLNVEYFKELDLESVERYICIYFRNYYKDHGSYQRVFVMAVKSELNKKEVLQELREDLEFQIEVLKQL